MDPGSSGPLVPLDDSQMDCSTPDSYRLSCIAFKDSQPLFPAYGLAWGSKDRPFMTSDTTGEIFIIGSA
ncbi:hypothetical protein WAI453_009954 [Rhynchosporium graminicola]